MLTFRNIHVNISPSTDGDGFLMTMDCFEKLDRWYHKPLGRALLRAESEQLSTLLPNMFGYYLLQLGLTSQHAWLSDSPIRNKVFLSPEHFDRQASLICPIETLPFPENSIDVILIPHTLDLISNPARVLEEACRVLIPEGHLIIFGFNPISFWGLFRLFKSKTKVPWLSHSATSQKMRVMLKELAMEVESVNSFFYRLPFKNIDLLRKTLFLESIGKIIWPYPGNAYCLVAKKSMATPTLIKPKWSVKALYGKKKVSGLTTR